MATKKIGIIGNGNVGSALARGLVRASYQVQNPGNDPAAVRATAEWADIVILAVPFAAVGSVAEVIAPVVTGKPIVDVTNALTADMKLALGYTTSGAEQLQQRLPRAHVVKAFNTQFAQHMDSGKLGDRKLTVFAAGDDEAARSDVLALATAIGFDAVSAGPLANARLLEPAGYLNIQLGYVLGNGPNIGLALVR